MKWLNAPLALGIGVVLLGAAEASSAQSTVDWDATRVYITRPALEEMLVRLGEASASPGYSARLRERADREARLIRARLEEGDFQVGDRIFLRVEGQPALTDTFTVNSSRAIDLPVMGAVPLAGVLRSELEERLRMHLSRFIRDPEVRSRSMIRIAIRGEVVTQGFFVVPTELVISDALMLAGGPTREARIDDIRIERGGEQLWGSENLAQAIAEGRTLDQLNLRAGDQIIVPQQTERTGTSVLRVLSTVVPLVAVLAALLF
jgi:protein involved in polysaccharide export with SLBB domain